MNSVLSTAGVLGALACAPFAVLAQDGPTIDETVAYIKEFSDRENLGVILAEGAVVETFEQTGFSSFPALGSCDFRFAIGFESALGHSIMTRDVIARDLDLSSIRTEHYETNGVLHSEVIVDVIPGRESAKIRDIRPTNSEDFSETLEQFPHPCDAGSCRRTIETDDFRILLFGEDFIAESGRVERALAHLVTLCGGAADPFAN